VGVANLESVGHGPSVSIRASPPNAGVCAAADKSPGTRADGRAGSADAGAKGLWPVSAGGPRVNAGPGLPQRWAAVGAVKGAVGMTAAASAAGPEILGTVPAKPAPAAAVAAGPAAAPAAPGAASRRDVGVLPPTGARVGHGRSRRLGRGGAVAPRGFLPGPDLFALRGGQGLQNRGRPRPFRPRRRLRDSVRLRGRLGRSRDGGWRLRRARAGAPRSKLRVCVFVARRPRRLPRGFLLCPDLEGRRGCQSLRKKAGKFGHESNGGTRRTRG
jgi:hypothetical protein